MTTWPTIWGSPPARLRNRWGSAMSTELLGGIVLVLVFIVGTLSSVNLGALALVASFGVGMGLAGEDLETVLGGFPVDMFLVLFGVTYLFGVATSNGTVEWLVQRCSRAVRGNRLVLPFVIFLVSAVPTAFGAVGPAVVALLAPVAMRVAQQNRMSPQLAGLLVVHGTTAGGFSPLNLGGVIVNGTLARDGVATSPLELFAASFAYNLLLGVVLVLVFDRWQSWRRPTVRTAVLAGHGPGAAAAPAHGGDLESRPEPAPELGPEPAAPVEGLDWTRGATLVAFLGVAVCAVGFGIDIGLLALSAAVLLQLLSPASSGKALSKVSWDAIVLICGLLTFVATLQRIGTVDLLGSSIARLDSPLFAALLILVVAALVSAFASTFGTIGALVPLSLPVLASGEVGAIGLAIALAISASVVDASPFSTNGALVMASAPVDQQRRTYRVLLRWGAAMVVTTPLVTWLVFVMAGS